MTMTRRAKTLVAGSAIAAASFGAGVAVAVSGAASATTDAVPGGLSQVAESQGPTQGTRSGEQPLSGATAQKVRAAVLAKYPEADVQRLETDAEGVYEAHIVTADGQELVVQVGKDFSVTGTQAFQRGGHGRGPGGCDGDGPSAPEGSTT